MGFSTAIPSATLFAAICAAVVWAGCPVPASAETRDEKFARLVSEDFAQQSSEALATGDRVSALDLALQGLPADPTETDLETYSEAYEAFLTAVVSRSLRLPMTHYGLARLDPAGQRIATIGMQWGGGDGRETAEPLKLWNASDGTLIRELLPVEATTTEDVGPGMPVFSPDGQLLAITAGPAESVILFSAADGRELWRGQVNRSDHVMPSFSRDGTRLLTGGVDPANGNSEAITVRDVASGDIVHSVVVDGGGCSISAAPGGSGSSVYYFVAAYDDGCDGGKRRVIEVTPDGARDAFVLDHYENIFLDFMPQVSKDGDRLMFLDETFSVVVVTPDGTQVARIGPDRMGEDFPTLGRDGTAIQVPTYGDGDLVEEMLVFDFNGNALPPGIEDRLGFVHLVHYPTGELFAEMNETTEVPGWPRYTGAGLPRGVALHDSVWQDLPEQRRQAIEENRVERP